MIKNNSVPISFWSPLYLDDFGKNRHSPEATSHKICRCVNKYFIFDKTYKCVVPIDKHRYRIMECTQTKTEIRLKQLSLLLGIPPLLALMMKIFFHYHYAPNKSATLIDCPFSIATNRRRFPYIAYLVEEFGFLNPWENNNEHFTKTKQQIGRLEDSPMEKRVRNDWRSIAESTSSMMQANGKEEMEKLGYRLKKLVVDGEELDVYESSEPFILHGTGGTKNTLRMLQEMPDTGKFSNNEDFILNQAEVISTSYYEPNLKIFTNLPTSIILRAHPEAILQVSPFDTNIPLISMEDEAQKYIAGREKINYLLNYLNEFISIVKGSSPEENYIKGNGIVQDLEKVQESVLLLTREEQTALSQQLFGNSFQTPISYIIENFMSHMKAIIKILETEGDEEDNLRAMSEYQAGALKKTNRVLTPKELAAQVPTYGEYSELGILTPKRQDKMTGKPPITEIGGLAVDSRYLEEGEEGLSIKKDKFDKYNSIETFKEVLRAAKERNVKIVLIRPKK